MTYNLLKNKTITQFADWKFSSDYMETEKTIIVHNGRLYFENDPAIPQQNSAQEPPQTIKNN